MILRSDQIILGVCGNALGRRGGVWYTHHSFGRIVSLLAERFREVRYGAPRASRASQDTCDFPLDAANITICPWPIPGSSLGALKRPDRLLRSYWRLTGSCDAVFLRGTWPLIWTAHLMARLRRRHVVHWVVGNPRAIMAGAQRGYGRRIQRLGWWYAGFELLMLRLAVKLSGSHLLANGAELAKLYRSKRTIQVVSTSITENDFFVRDDTCSGETIRLLFVGFVRPEKGLEFALRAIPQIAADREVRLAIVGSWDQFSHEHERLTRLAEQLHLSDRIDWEGYIPFGPDLFDQMDRSDILVLPSLTEGTPRVLVEARARSLPVVSTDVGGIPSSVTDGRDGLLVPPRDATRLAQAISRVITDRDLRQQLIRRGRDRVKELTVERFVDLVVSTVLAAKE
ncbi:MAG: glycosyltransferase [Phycisphaerae bacterium]|jgi:glycosyltransferase involved in cell wall biosynthesis